jgi:hypothetical protein
VRKNASSLELEEVARNAAISSLWDMSSATPDGREMGATPSRSATSRFTASGRLQLMHIS